MAALNSGNSFGWVSRGLHWLMAAGVLGMIGLGLTLVSIKPSLSTLWLYALHKSTGLSLLTLVLFRIAWHRISPPPAPLADAAMARWQLRAARWAHVGLYALMLTIPLTGWIASSAAGIDILLWNRITMPRIAPVSAAWETGFFLVHKILTRALMALLVLHVAGVAHRALVIRDRTLHRMLGG